MQATYSFKRLEDPESVKFVEELFSSLFCNGQIVLTMFESISEIDMKQYLVKPMQRWSICKGKCWIIRNINDIWRFIKDKHFVCIHLNYSKEQLLEPSFNNEFISTPAQVLNALIQTIRRDIL